MTGDLRLVGPALACWATTALALLCPRAVTWTLTVLWATAAVVAAVVLVCRSISGRRRAVTEEEHGHGVTAAATVLGLCGLAAAAGAVCAIRIGAVERSPVSSLSGTPAMTLQVAGDPVVFSSGTGAQVPVRVLEAEGRAQRPVRALLVLRTSQMIETVPGQRITVSVRVRPPRGGAADRLIAARLTALETPTVVAPAPVWQRWAGSVRELLRERAARALPPRAASLFPGLILGDTGDLDPGLREHFRAAGLTHLVAVSGANFSIVCGAVVLALRIAGASTRLTVALGLLTMVGFVILVRPTDSVLRAAIMGGVGLLGALAARRAQALPALGAAIIVVLLFWPQMALAPGFVLSVVATLGLVLWAAPLREAMTRRGVPEPLAVLLAMTLAAQILTTPLVIAITDRLSLVALPANLLAAPVVGVIAVLGTGAAVVGALGPADGLGAAVGELLIRATGPEMWWLVAVADALGGRSWSAPTVPGWQAGLVLTLAGGFGWSAWRSAAAPRR